MTTPISSLSCCPRSRPSRAQQHHTHHSNYESASECETETNLSRRAWSRLSCVLTRAATKHDLRRGLTECTIQLSATDVLAPTSMKNAAKCDTSCELQNPVNHQNFERTLRFRDIPGSMPVGVSAHTPLTPLGGSIKRLACCAVESERRFTLHVKVKRPSKSRPAHMERAFQDFGTCCLVFGSLRPVHCGCGKFSRTPSPACREKSDSWDRVHFVVVRRSLPCQDLEGLET